MLREYVEQLPRLRAQESLTQITEIAVGTGSVKKEEGSRIRRELVASAQEKFVQVHLTLEQQKAMLADMGIGLKWQKN